MLRFLFVAIILIIGLIGAIRSRFAALLLYVWFALFRPQEWVWIDLTSYRLSLVLGLLLVVPSLLTGIMPVLAHPISIGMVAFLTAALVAQTQAVDPAIAAFWLDFMFKLILVSVFASRLTNTKHRLILLVAVTAASFGGRSALAGLESLLAGGTRYGEGVGGAFIDNNAYGIGTVMIIPFLIAAAQNVRARAVKWLFAIAVPLCAFTVVSTYSRGAFLALATCVLAYIMLGRRKLITLAVAAALLPIIISFAPINKDYFSRLQTIGTYEEVGDDSALGRLHFWRVALDIARDRPLGIGLWNFEATYDQYDFLQGQYGHRRAVHNSYLQALTETGWIGGVAWISLFIVALRLCFRARSNAKRLSPDDARFMHTTTNAMIVSITSFMIGGGTVSMAYNDLTWFTFAIAAAIDLVSKQMAVEHAADPACSTRNESLATA